jgi:hypothetical protein
MQCMLSVCDVSLLANAIDITSLLPFFRTLAARRRRVLHVVADSWEPDGGKLPLNTHDRRGF